MRTAAFAAALGLALAGCGSGVVAPEERNVCFHVGTEGEDVQFNVVARDQESLEVCAARLEEMRVNFLRLGGSNQEIAGAYNGQFIFIDRAGIWVAQEYEGGRFFFLARTGDGRLAMPGVIQRSAEENQPDR